MTPKDWYEIRDGIAALLRGFVGMPGDTGGSQTAGTVMDTKDCFNSAL